MIISTAQIRIQRLFEMGILTVKNDAVQDTFRLKDKGEPTSQNDEDGFPDDSKNQYS